MTETSRDWAYVLGVDPGTTTGLTLVRFYMADRGKPEYAWSNQLPRLEAGRKVRQVLALLAEDVLRGDAMMAAVAPEQFTLNAQSAQRGQQGADDALGLLGVVDHFAAESGVEVGPRETASAAKNLINDDVLRALDLWQTGQKHANDASRHALLFAVKRKWLHTSWLAAHL